MMSTRQRNPLRLAGPFGLSNYMLGRFSSISLRIGLFMLGLLARHSFLACDCETVPFVAKAAVGEASAVFLGTVVSIQDRPVLLKELSQAVVVQVVRFRATEGWKGITKADVQVTAGSGLDCDFRFSEGKRYLVFAFRSEAGAELTTSQCTYTEEIWRERQLDPIRLWRKGRKIAK
jgi:hypothetical protein